MNISCRIDILLSTFNGAEYLSEQLESIAAQDIDEWQLIIRDDSSTDNSISIIKEFALKHPDRVLFISEPSVKLGVTASYDCLLAKSQSPYVAFCDQDDVWLPDKLKILRERIQHLEGVSKPETPILVHSDLYVVNDNLGNIADSFWKYQKLNPEKMQTFERLLTHNCVTGCAMLINKPLVDYVLPISGDAIVHDWWIALIAASKGKIDHINLKTVKYRQHTNNNTGAKKWGWGYILEGIFRHRNLYKENIKKTRDQAKALLLSGKLSNEHTEIVSQYVQLFDNGWFSRRLTMFRVGFFKYGLIRNVAFFLWV